MNEFGKPSLEEIFHPLRTRLYNIKSGNIEPEDGIYDGIDDYCSRKIKPILAGIFSFEGILALDMIDKTLAVTNELLPQAEDLAERVTEDYVGFAIGTIGNQEYDSKKEAAKDIQNELAYYTDKLSKLKSEITKTSGLAANTTKSISHAIELPDDFKPPKFKTNSVLSFDKYQSALLFYLLKQKGAILNFSDSSLATVISCATGHSAQNIRQDVLGRIWNVLQDKEKNKTIDTPNYNLLVIKKLLTDIILDLDAQIKTNESSKL